MRAHVKRGISRRSSRMKLSPLRLLIRSLPAEQTRQDSVPEIMIFVTVEPQTFEFSVRNSSSVHITILSVSSQTLDTFAESLCLAQNPLSEPKEQHYTAPYCGCPLSSHLVASRNWKNALSTKTGPCESANLNLGELTDKDAYPERLL